MRKEECYITIKGSIHQKDKAINIYAPNTLAPKHMKQTLIEDRSIHLTIGTNQNLTLEEGETDRRYGQKDLNIL